MRYAPIRAGSLDKRVTIQTRNETDDGAGGQTIVYADLATVWASIEPGTGREFVAAQQLQPELSHIVTIRYRSDVTAKHRIKYVSNGVARSFAIHIPVDPLERHEQLVLYCSELTPT